MFFLYYYGVFFFFMGAVVEKVHKEFKANSIGGVAIKYNPRGNIFKMNNNRRGGENECIRIINEVLFVDDIVQFSPSKSVENKKLEIWNRVLDRYNQEMSIPKTNTMKTGKGVDDEIGITVSVNGIEIKEVEKFKYLGIVERPDNSMESEFNARKRAMICAFR